MQQLTVVGGGLSGLIAATECAEAGVPVRLMEARSRVGGRGGTIPGDWHANLGPHALYAGGPMWDWLRARALHQPFRTPHNLAVRFRHDGTVRRTPPLALLHAARLRKTVAPSTIDLRSWLTDLTDERTAAAVSGAAGVLTFDHDPGRLSADFVWSRFGRLLATMPPAARYVVGGWGRMVDRVEAHARDVGVVIETGAKVDALPDGPVIVAVEPAAARRLLGADLPTNGTRSVLVDLGLSARRGDPYLISDLDEGAFINRFTAVDTTSAPRGFSMVQAVIGQRPGETLSSGVARIETILDLGYVDWRERTVWRRRASVAEASGALDFPGTTWRDRPAIVQGDGVWLAGDWVAAPGHLVEVGCNSAVEAARFAVAAMRRSETFKTGRVPSDV